MQTSEPLKEAVPEALPRDPHRLENVVFIRPYGRPK